MHTRCLLALLLSVAPAALLAQPAQPSDDDPTAVPGTLALEPCSLPGPMGEADVRCGKMLVPEDPDHPDGRRMRFENSSA